ncbi:hypothetical protein QCD77_27585, partial [Pseudomonas savastanoi pv. phaseolicola]|nr:hypothetical protein [Pseudomonas savastanoi pv. phaseolicola]
GGTPRPPWLSNRSATSAHSVSVKQLGYSCSGSWRRWVAKLLHGEENVVCADAGYTGVEKREEHAGRKVIWQI